MKSNWNKGRFSLGLHLWSKWEMLFYSLCMVGIGITLAMVWVSDLNALEGNVKPPCGEILTQIEAINEQSMDRTITITDNGKVYTLLLLMDGDEVLYPDRD